MWIDFFRIKPNTKHEKKEYEKIKMVPRNGAKNAKEEKGVAVVVK